MNKSYGSAEAIGFIEKPDGRQAELSVGERRQAARGFQELVDDTFLRHMSAAKSYDAGVVSPYSQSNILLGVLQDDGSRLSISVQSNSTKEVDYAFPRELSIQEISPDGYDHRYYRYKLARDGTEVTRLDVGDVSQKILADKTKRPDPKDYRAMIGFTENIIEELTNEIENQKLEKSLGLNDQPVGSDEIAKLTEILDSATPQKLF